MNILFIEDEENARLGLCAILASLGHVVDEAESADAAVALLRDNVYELLLLDIMIPPGNCLPGVAFREAGKELLKGLRSGRFGPLKTPADVRVVVSTAVADLGVAKGLQEADPVFVLTKPLTAEEALDRIRPLLGP